MPLKPIEHLSDDARVWVFPIAPAPEPRRAGELLGDVDRYLEQWTAHGEPVVAARELREGSLLVIAADEGSHPGGCSIDGLFRMLRQQLGDAALDSSRIVCRDGDGHLRVMQRSEFRAKADPHTVVIDTTVQRLGEVRGGTWERPAEKSWHRELLR